MKNFLVSQALAALCLFLVYLVSSGAAEAETTPVYTEITQHYDQRNFNFGGMYSTVVNYIVRAINFTYNLINSPPVCHLLNNCKETEVQAPIPLNQNGFEHSPYSVEENLISHGSLTNTEYTGPLIDALLAANVDNTKSHTTFGENDKTKDTSGHEEHEEHSNE